MNFKELKKIAEAATPGPWEVSTNIPFYTVVNKPEQSLSKHDSERPTYWRYEDGVFHSVFNPTQVLELLKEIDKLKKKLAEYD